MAIPEYIRKVPRPVNTVVVDNGKDGPNRYAVWERAGTKNSHKQDKGNVHERLHNPPKKTV